MAMPESPGQELVACSEMAMWVRGAPRVARAGFPARPGGGWCVSSLLTGQERLWILPSFGVAQQKIIISH